MKTALRDLIEEIQYWKEKAPVGSAFRDCLIILEGSATNKLEKEKSQLKRAYKDCHDYFHRYGLDAEKYFNENFEQK